MKGFDGVCWSLWLWFDIDREDIGQALQDARRLVAFIAERYGLDDDALLIFFSGSKGFHVGLPTSLWQPSASVTFNTAARRLAEALADVRRLAAFVVERYSLDGDELLLFFSGSKGFHVGLPSSLWEPSASVTFHAIVRHLAEALAERAGVVIDAGVYDRVRAFRAPNSRHPKTGLHKRRLTFDELMGLSVDAIKRMAERPEAFDVPTLPPVNEQAATDWREAVHSVERTTEAKAERRAAGMSSRLNRATRDIIANVETIAAGDRHRLLFSAAANLAELGCPPALAHELLTEAGRDAGLSPSEVRRQIDCGLSHHSTTGGPAQ